MQNSVFRAHKLFEKNFSPFIHIMNQLEPTFFKSFDFLDTSGYPVMDVFTQEEDGGETTLHYHIAVPGVDPQDIEVSVHEKTKTLRVTNHAQSESSSEANDGRRHYYSRRIARRKFDMSLHLPKGYVVDEERVSICHGILHVALRPTEHSEDDVTKITIKSSP